VLQEDFLTLAEHLKSFEYSTGAFIGAYPLDSKFGLAQGFDVYNDDYGSPSSEGLAYVERKAGEVVDQALEWLKTRKSPWFLFIHCFDPHTPYEPPEPFKTKNKNHLYEGEIAYVDNVLERLLNYLEEKDLYRTARRKNPRLFCIQHHPLDTSFDLCARTKAGQGRPVCQPYRYFSLCLRYTENKKTFFSPGDFTAARNKRKETCEKTYLF
jgi:hypothetical protein